MYSCKQVIVMRRDLGMRKGKIAAQAGHACVEALLRALCRDGLTDRVRWTGEGGIQIDWPAEDETPPPAVRWFRDGEAKICVYCDGEEALLALHERIQAAGHISALICDAGHTEFHGEPTLTCLAMEPLPSEEADRFTGEMKLY